MEGRRPWALEKLGSGAKPARQEEPRECEVLEAKEAFQGGGREGSSANYQVFLRQNQLQLSQDQVELHILHINLSSNLRLCLMNRSFILQASVALRIFINAEDLSEKFI